MNNQATIRKIGTNVLVRSHKRKSKNKVTVVKQHARKHKLSKAQDKSLFGALRKANAKAEAAPMSKQAKIDANDFAGRMGRAKALSLSRKKSKKA